MRGAEVVRAGGAARGGDGGEAACLRADDGKIGVVRVVVGGGGEMVGERSGLADHKLCIKRGRIDREAPQRIAEIPPQWLV